MGLHCDPLNQELLFHAEQLKSGALAEERRMLLGKSTARSLMRGGGGLRGGGMEMGVDGGR